MEGHCFSENCLSLEESLEETELEIFTKVIKYFGMWQSIDNHQDPLSFLQQAVLPKLNFEELQLSLQVRGKVNSGLTKLQMVHILYNDLKLEIKVMGENFQRSIRENEIDILDLIRRERNRIAKTLLVEVYDAWQPVRLVQLQEDSKIMKELLQIEHLKRKELDDLFEAWCLAIKQKPEGDSLINKTSLETPRVYGFTAKGPNFCSGGVGKTIFAGSHHAGLIHFSGNLYTWGVGTSGRLGRGTSGDVSTSILDTSRPTLVRALDGYAISMGSCGQCHTGVVSSRGELFVWGSASEGKLGLGDDTQGKECYVGSPVQLLLPNCRRVVKVSCGASHTAAIGEAGKLFVWGCADGGRLGLGRNEMFTHYHPRLVESLLHETCVDVSCGSFQTLAITILDDSCNRKNPENPLRGGKLYVAGSEAVLGKFYPQFHLEESILSTPIKHISAGYLHQLATTYSGEVLSWGNNRDGCCGHTEDIAFINKPKKIPALFEKPTNLARAMPSKQSSIWGGLDAHIAVDGNRDGSKYIHTHLEAKPYWEVDLGSIFIITEVKLWNRTDIPKERTDDRDKYTKRLFPCW